MRTGHRPTRARGRLAVGVLAAAAFLAVGVPTAAAQPPPTTPTTPTATTTPTAPAAPAAPAGSTGSTGSTAPTGSTGSTAPGTHPGTHPASPSGGGGADPSGTAPQLCDAACATTIQGMVNTHLGALWADLFGFLGTLGPPATLTPGAPAPDTPTPPADTPTQPTGAPVDTLAAPTGTPTGTPADTTSATGTPTDPATAAAVLAAVNADRATAGCGPLTDDPTADTVATGFAQQMADAKVTAATLSHTAPDGTTAQTRLAGLTGGTAAAAENIAMGYPDPAKVVAAWVKSPGHKANIENCTYTVSGIGEVTAPDGTTYWVQEFLATTPTSTAPGGSTAPTHTTPNPTSSTTPTPAATTPAPGS